MTIQEGWLGKPKGALQVLFEQGWIDPNLIQHYTGNGMKENRRSIINAPTDLTGCNYSVNAIMKL